MQYVTTRNKDDSGKANEQDSDVFHHDEGRKRQDDFSVDVRHLLDALRSRRNPFLEAGVDLVNLDGRISNAKDVSAIHDKGKDQYDQFVNDVTLFTPGPLLAESEVWLALEQNWLE